MKAVKPGAAAEEKPEGAQPAGASGQEQGSQAPAEGEELTYEVWFEALSDEQKALVEDHTHNLKKALDSERGDRKKLEKELRDAAKQLEEGSAARQSVEDMATKLAEEGRRATFYEQASGAGVRNLRLAYVAAREAGLFGENGEADFEKMKADYPELFETKRTLPPGNAGEGAGGGGAGPRSMNDIIRAAAGRRP